MGIYGAIAHYRAAEAARNPFQLLGGQREGQIVHPVFPGGPVALSAPGLVIGLRARCRQLLPCSLEADAGLVERFGNAAAMLPGGGARMEAATPGPLWGGVRHTGR